MTAWRRPAGGTFGWRTGSTSTIKALLVANISIYLLMVLLGPRQEQALREFFGLVPADALPHLYLWQFLTYMFLHGGLLHVGFNMFALWMFGSEIEALWGRRVFLQYYLFSGLGGSVLYTITSWGSPIPMIGASGAVFGILLAYGLLFPERRILLYFLFPIKAKYFVLLYGLLTFFLAQHPNTGGVAHFAHLGGMLFGFVYLRAGLYRHGGSGLLGGLRESWRRRRARARLRVVRPERPGPAPPEQARVDEILEKISKHGLQSLTRQEQEILRRASRKH